MSFEDNIKGRDKVFPVHSVKVYSGSKLSLHSTMALGGSEGLTSRPGLFTTGERTSVLTE
jgi:hypothetical protein